MVSRRTPSRPSERSRALAVGALANRSLPRPDPRGHARALIESFGYRSALQIAGNNARIERRREDYWPRVLAAVQEEQA
jgi:hypothetical protein